MRFALKDHVSAIAFVAVVLPAMSVQRALADGAFITQATKETFFGHSLVTNPMSGQSPAPHGGVTQATPETTVPATGGNFARTLEMGVGNLVVQAQSGFGNVSNVGIIGGNHDSVGVFQHGQGLVSNLALIGVKGLTVDVLQPPGTAPVDMLIAKLPNGMLDILQPKGAPPATIIRVGNALVVK